MGLSTLTYYNVDIETVDRINTIYESIQASESPVRLYPDGADAITLTSGSSKWAGGSEVIIIPASTFSTEWCVMQVIFEDVSKRDVAYQVDLHTISNDFIGSARGYKASDFSSMDGNLIPCKILQPEVGIKAILKTSSNSTETLDLVIGYQLCEN